MQVPLFGHGGGRRGSLREPITVQETINKVKAHLGLPYIRAAIAQGSTLGTFSLFFFFFAIL